MDSVNNTIVSEINSLKQTATDEKAEKTVAAIDGILLARQMGFDELNNEFQKIQQEQGVQNLPNITDMPDMQNMPDFQGQEMMPGRGMRGQETMPMQGRGMRGR